MAVEECWVEPTMGYEPLHVLNIEVDAYVSGRVSHETASCTYVHT